MSKLANYNNITVQDDSDLGADSTSQEMFEDIMESRFGGADTAHQLLLHYIRRRNNLNPSKLTSEAIRDDFQNTLRNIIMMMNEESGRRNTWPSYAQERAMKANVAMLHREMKKSGVIITRTGFRFPKVEVEDED